MARADLFVVRMFVTALIAAATFGCHRRHDEAAATAELDRLSDAGLRQCLGKLRAVVGMSDPQATRLAVTRSTVELAARSGSDRDDVFDYACRRGEIGPPVLDKRAVVQPATFPLSAIAFDGLFAKIARVATGTITRVAITQEPPSQIVIRVDVEGGPTVELDAHGNRLERQAPTPWPPPEQAVSRAGLGSADLLETWSTIDDAGVPGDPAAFDPIAQLPWVRGLATAWRGDAFLYDVTITNPRTSGTVDLAAGGGAQYWFQSPRDGRSASVLVDAPAGRPRARISPVDAPPQRAIAGAPCALRRAIAASKQPPSSIDLVIDARKREVWRWWDPSAVVQAGSGAVKPLVSIDAATCKRLVD
jgi:hypothetical protein